MGRLSTKPYLLGLRSHLMAIFGEVACAGSFRLSWVAGKESNLLALGFRSTGSGSQLRIEFVEWGLRVWSRSWFIWLFKKQCCAVVSSNEATGKIMSA